MRRALVLIMVCLAVAVPANAVPMWVTIWIMEGFTSTQVGTGGFTFDSEYFITDPNAPLGFSGLIPAYELEPDAGVDFFAGSLDGTHFDFSDVHLEWWDGYFAPVDGGGRPVGGLNWPQWSWGWHTTAGGYPISGWDGPGGFNVGDEFFMARWWGGTGSPPDEDKVVCVPEPPSIALFAAGLVGAGLVRRRLRVWGSTP